LHRIDAGSDLVEPVRRIYPEAAKHVVVERHLAHALHLATGGQVRQSRMTLGVIRVGKDGEGIEVGVLRGQQGYEATVSLELETIRHEHTIEGGPFLAG